jgi:hypothetical protein
MTETVDLAKQLQNELSHTRRFSNLIVKMRNECGFDAAKRIYEHGQHVINLMEKEHYDGKALVLKNVAGDEIPVDAEMDDQTAAELKG